MRRAALLLMLIAFTEIAHAQDACREDLYTEVVRSEDIMRSGAARFSDLLALSDRWIGFSADGYDWDFASTGLPDHQRWRIYVDDKLLPLGLLGKANLNLIPIHVYEVDCIEFVSGPDPKGPHFAPFGSVRIYTKTPPAEVTLHGGVAAGNEVNDPGPFFYTPMSSPNIDRVGPLGFVDVSASGPRGYARLSGNLDEFHVTDNQINERAISLYTEDSKPSINVEATALTARWRGQSLLLAKSRTHDLLFFPQVGVELPSTHALEMAGLSGQAGISRAKVDYHAGVVTHDLQRRPNRRNLRMDFGEQRIFGGGAIALEDGPVALRLGGSVESIEARSSQQLSDPQILTTRLHAGVAARVQAWRHYLFAEWLQSDARPAASVYYRGDVALDSINSVSASVSYGRRLNESESFWLWSARGYSLPESGPVSGLPYEPSPRFVSADLEWRSRPLREIRGTLRAYYRWFDGEYLPQYNLAVDSVTSGLVGSASLRPAISGSLAGGGFTVDASPAGPVRGRLTYNLSFRVDGDDAVRRSIDRIPFQRLSVTAIYVPVERFSLFARFDYRPATSWHEYEAVAGESQGLYVHELSDMMLLDIAATKRLWKDHILATLLLRNVLNEPVRYHPVGAVFNMAFHFALQVQFNSEAGL